MNRLRERYEKEITPALIKDLELSNIMQVPHVKKVIVNIGLEKLWITPRHWMLLRGTWQPSRGNTR